MQIKLERLFKRLEENQDLRKELVTFKVSPRITEEPPKIKKEPNKDLKFVNADTDLELLSQGYVL